MILTSLTRDALDNARHSLHDISRAIGERAELQHHTGGRGDLAVLTAQECSALLESSSVGRLAYIARAGIVDIVPVNFRWYDGTALVRSGPGPKLQAADREEVVALEVDCLDATSRSGWSVVVTGAAVRVPPEQARALALPDTWVEGPRLHVVRIRPHRVTGRRLL